jgi:acetolactate decarboxylase
MIQKHYKTLFLSLSLLTLASCAEKTPISKHEVKIVGEMKNVMRKGELHATIDLDTIADKAHLYGLGPVEYLKGEIMVYEGKAYKSTVVSDSTMLVEETFDIKAPFFGYANVPNWIEQALPENIETIAQLEVYLNETTQNATRPFMFKLTGTVVSANFHIVNLPDGTKVSSHEDAHQGMVNYQVQNEDCEIIGFFSTEHQTILTHHDTYLHMHLMTSDRQKMGHLDGVTFKKGAMKLYLPKE